MKEISADLFYPRVIFSINDFISAEENEIIKEYSLEIKNKYSKSIDYWKCDVLSTFSQDIPYNQSLFNLKNNISNAIIEYSRFHGSSTKEYKCESMWLNYYSNGDHQEYHTHNGSIISAVYYVSAPEYSGRIIFKDPFNDMLPLKNLEIGNQFSQSEIYYQPMERQLLIFRSYMPHMVEKCDNNIDRISYALNFI